MDEMYEENQLQTEEVAYSVDIALLIDATGSMNPIINKTKKRARTLCSDFVQAMDANDIPVDKLRMKVIAFRDYAYDAEEDAMNESPFFNLPDQEDELADFIDKIQAKGGGDFPENSLEAICLAMRSDWDVETPGRHRHVILLFTDAPAVPLEDDSMPMKALRKRKDNPNYPKGIPSNWKEMSDWWIADDSSGEGMPEQRAKRLILFAPDAEAWQKIASSYDLVWHVVTKANEGCDECDFLEALNMIFHDI